MTGQTARRRVKLLTDMDRSELEALAAQALASSARPEAQTEMPFQGAGQGSSTATEALNSAIETEAQRMRRDNSGANFKQKLDCYTKMKAFAQFVQDFEKKLLPETSLEYVLGVLVGFFDREVEPFGVTGYPYYATLVNWIERRKQDRGAALLTPRKLLKSCRGHLPAP